jgi:hypothetical protein
LVPDGIEAMTESTSSLLAGWSSFYVMTGSSAAALIGLMFIVITLVMATERVRRSPDGIATFSTPTVMHFCAAFFVSATMSAPWRSLGHPAVPVGLVGLWGLVYIVRVIWRTRRLTIYTPDVEDWTWYSILPFAAYSAILGGAIALHLFPIYALFALAGGVVLLIFIGIRNSWDIVTFLAIGGFDQPRS